MTYFCFIEIGAGKVPHMEPLDADTLHDAKAQAAAMLLRHSTGTTARVVKDGEHLATVNRLLNGGLRPRIDAS